MTNEVVISEDEPTEEDIAKREKFYERYRDVTAERLPRVLLQDVLLLGESSELEFNEYEWAVAYAENYVNARN